MTRGTKVCFRDPQCRSNRHWIQSTTSWSTPSARFSTTSRDNVRPANRPKAMEKGSPDERALPAKGMGPHGSLTYRSQTLSIGTVMICLARCVWMHMKVEKDACAWCAGMCIMCIAGTICSSDPTIQSAHAQFVEEERESFRDFVSSAMRHRSHSSKTRQDHRRRR